MSQRLFLIGDEDKAIAYSNYAKGKLRLMKEQMSRLNLPEMSANYQVDDVFITVSSSYGQDTIYISTEENNIYFIAYVGEDTTDFSNKKYYKLVGSRLQEVTKNEVEIAKNITLLDDGLYYFDLYNYDNIELHEEDFLNPDNYLFKGDIDNDEFLGVPSSNVCFNAKTINNGYYRYVLGSSSEEEQADIVVMHHGQYYNSKVSPTCSVSSNIYQGLSSQSFVSTYTKDGIIFRLPSNKGVTFIGNVTVPLSIDVVNELNMDFYMKITGNIFFYPFEKNKSKQVYKEVSDDITIAAGWSAGYSDSLNNLNMLIVSNLKSKSLPIYSGEFKCCLFCKKLCFPDMSDDWIFYTCAYSCGYCNYSYKSLNYTIESIEGKVVEKFKYTKSRDTAYLTQNAMTYEYCCEDKTKCLEHNDIGISDCLYYTIENSSNCKAVKLFPDCTTMEYTKIRPYSIKKFPFTKIEDDFKIIHSTTIDGGYNYRRYQKINDEESGNILSSKVGVYCNNELVEESEMLPVIQKHKYRHCIPECTLNTYIFQQNYDIVSAYNQNGFNILFYRKYIFRELKRYPFYSIDEQGKKIAVLSADVYYACGDAKYLQLMINDVIVDVTNYIYVNGKIHKLKPRSVQHELFIDVEAVDTIEADDYRYSSNWYKIRDALFVNVSYGTDGYGNIINEEDSINEQVIRSFIDSNGNYALFVVDIFPLQVFRKSIIKKFQTDNIPTFDIVYPATDYTIKDEYGEHTIKTLYPTDGVYKTPNDRLWLLFDRNGIKYEVESPINEEEGAIYNRINGCCIV